MIYGDPQQIAVEVDLGHCHEQAVGHFGYIISGHRVGDFDTVVPLLDFLIATKWMVHDCGNRYDSDLLLLERGALFERIDSALYTGGEPVNGEAVDDEVWARFDITPSIETFNSWKVFLVDGGNLSRIVFRRERGPVKEMICPRGLFDTAIKLAFDAVETTYELISRDG